MKQTEREYWQILVNAHQAGMTAGSKVRTPTMIVYEADPVTGEKRAGGKQWEVPDGPCGFAWITLRPATSSFARWLKKQGWRKGYHGGIQFHVREFNQSLIRKEAYAEAFAAVIRNYGYDAYAESRMD